MPGRKLAVLRVALFSFSLILLLSACRNDENNSAAKKNNADKAYPDVLKITRCLYFGDSSDNQDLKEEFVRVFSEKTGINLEVIYPPRINYMDKVNLMIASGELDGMVNFFSPDNIAQAIDDGTIEPLDEYLKDNKNWNSMPEEYRNTYKINGKIYAVQGGYEGGFFTRSFRKDWLDNLGLAIPGTADELFEVARAFTGDDPDRNGIDDTNGLTSSMFWNLQDIFQAFGARLGNTGEIPIAWDPVSGVWQDSMLKPEMADALAYIKKLYDYGYLDKDFITNEGSNMKENLWKGKSGSAFYWAMHACRRAATEMRDTLPEAEWVEIPALKGRETEMLNGRVMGGLIYVLVKGTEQPEETVNTFVDIMFDRDIYFMLRFGIEGSTFRWNEDSIIVMTNPDTGKPYESSSLLSDMPQFSRFKIPWCYDGTPEEMQESLNYIKMESRILEKGLSENLIFDVCGAAYDSPISKEFSTKSADVLKIFESETCKAILGEKPVEQALDDYRTRMRELGADRMLKEANEYIGKTPGQKY